MSSAPLYIIKLLSLHICQPHPSPTLCAPAFGLITVPQTFCLSRLHSGPASPHTNVRALSVWLVVNLPLVNMSFLAPWFLMYSMSPCAEISVFWSVDCVSLRAHMLVVVKLEQTL